MKYMKNLDKYKNYFKTHYNYSFTDSDLKRHENWFYSQWSFIKSKITFSKNSNVLEIGSSIGGFVQFLKNEKFSSVVGIDLDEDAVAFSKKSFPGYTFYKKSLESFENKKKFKYIFSFEVLEHVSSPIHAIASISDLLSKSGIFIGTSPYPYVKNVLADNTHTYVLHPSNWKKLFLDNGFRQVETYPLTYLPFIWRLNKYLNLRIPVYLPFKYFISTTLIIARK